VTLGLKEAPKLGPLKVRCPKKKAYRVLPSNSTKAQLVFTAPELFNVTPVSARITRLPDPNTPYAVTKMNETEVSSDG
jgi:hypothetical protein